MSIQLSSWWRRWGIAYAFGLHSTCLCVKFLGAVPISGGCRLVGQANQEEETINHLLVSCVFAWQFWFFLLQHFGIHQFCPQLTYSSFDLWWENSSNAAAAGLTRKGFNSLVILGAWILWNRCNRCVFDGATPSLVGALGFALEESRLWASTYFVQLVQ